MSVERTSAFDPLSTLGQAVSGLSNPKGAAVQASRTECLNQVPTTPIRRAPEIAIVLKVTLRGGPRSGT